ncbi:MAG: hypothetical protein ACK4TG_09985 [Thermaurantiacus sp.]
MTDTNFQIARKMADRLLATEDAIDAAFREAADLASFMPVARQEARVSVGLGQDAIEQIIATMAMLGEARRNIGKTHAALSVVQRRIGLPETNFGGLIDKPRHQEKRENGALRTIPGLSEPAPAD